MRYTATFSLLLLLFLGIHSCKTTKDTSMLLNSLKGSEWEVQELNGSALDPDNYTSRGLPTLIFLEDGKVSGNTGCNQYQASYKINGSELEIKPGAMTKRFCQDVDEVGFMDALTQTSQIESKGGNLVLHGGGEDLMKLKRKLD